MGLAERRAVKAYQDDVFPAKQKAIQEAAGFEVPLEIDWTSLGVDDYAHMYEEAFSKVYFDPLIDALKSICRDDMGRDALRNGLKKIVIRNTGGHYSPSRFTFEDGVLTIDHEPCSNIDDVNERFKGVESLLEKGL